MTQTHTAWTKSLTVAQTREQDAKIRRQAPGIAIIDLNKLMTDMASDIPPELRTPRERRAYLHAVTEIAWYARACALEHGLEKGDLYPCPHIIQGLSTVNDNNQEGQK
jgi:hypothetical protein